MKRKDLKKISLDKGVIAKLTNIQKSQVKGGLIFPTQIRCGEGGILSLECEGV